MMSRMIPSNRDNKMPEATTMAAAPTSPRLSLSRNVRTNARYRPFAKVCGRQGTVRRVNRQISGQVAVGEEESGE